MYSSFIGGFRLGESAELRTHRIFEEYAPCSKRMAYCTSVKSFRTLICREERKLVCFRQSYIIEG